MEIKYCHDCGVKEGEVHDYGCDNEICPFCGNQLISCRCIYSHLGIIDTSKYNYSTAYLPPDIYKNGVTVKQGEIWLTILNGKGRIPYIDWPLMCAKCGVLWPEFFRVEAEEWKEYIQPNMRKSMVCPKCFDFIKMAINASY